MIALYENQPVSARVRLTDDDYLRTRYYLHPHGTADITVGRGRDWTVLACKECYGKAVKTVLDLEPDSCVFDLSPAARLGQPGLNAALEGILGGSHRKADCLTDVRCPALTCYASGSGFTLPQLTAAWQLAEDIMAVRGPGIGPLMGMLLHQGLVLGAVHAPQLGAVEGIGGAHIHAVLGGADGAQAVVGAVAEAIPGDGVEIHAVLGHQQVKAVLALLGIVVAAEVVHKVVDQVVIHGLVQGGKDGLHRILQAVLQTLGIGAVHSHAGDLGVFLGKVCAVQLHAQQVEHLLLEGLILLQHVPVIGHGVLVSGHVRGKACQHLIQMGGILGKQDLVQEPGQILVVVLLQNLQHGVLQHIGPAADVGIVHIGHR